MDSLYNYFQIPSSNDMVVTGPAKAAFGAFVGSVADAIGFPNSRTVTDSLVTTYVAYAISVVVEPAFKALEQQNKLWVIGRYATSAAATTVLTGVVGFNKGNSLGSFFHANLSLVSGHLGSDLLRRADIIRF